MNITSAIAKITSGSNLTESEMSEVMLDLLEGKATDAQIGAFLIALSMKGESVEEVLGGAKIMRQLSAKVAVNADNLVDTCGTGGSGIGIFNVSTTAAFLAVLVVLGLQNMEIGLLLEKAEVQIYWRQLAYLWN